MAQPAPALTTFGWPVADGTFFSWGAFTSAVPVFRTKITPYVTSSLMTSSLFNFHTFEPHDSWTRRRQRNDTTQPNATTLSTACVPASSLSFLSGHLKIHACRCTVLIVCMSPVAASTTESSRLSATRSPRARERGKELLPPVLLSGCFPLVSHTSLFDLWPPSERQR